LLALGAAVFVAAAVLPSALVLPQTNPARTLEYAPVPADSGDTGHPGGNLSSLGLAGSRSLTLGAAGRDDATETARGPHSVGKNPSTKLCVGRPPRQTSDPLSPPCVAHFVGDNFGATSQGVTAGEVRIVFYFDGYPPNGGFRGPTSRGAEAIPSDVYYDLGEPASGDEIVDVRMLRLLQRYFNARYQTYQRFVRFIVHYGRTPQGDPSNATWTPEVRRADVADAWAKYRPFAVISYAVQNSDAYVQAAVDRREMVFAGGTRNVASGRVGYPASFYRAFPGMVWSFDPSLEQRAEVFTSYLCAKVVGKRVTFTGNDADRGLPRTLGLLTIQDPRFPEVAQYTKLIRAGVERCGGTIALELPHDPNDQPCFRLQDGVANMAQFQERKVTTIVWVGGIDSCQTKGAAAIGYRPEWVVAGDNVAETNAFGRFHDQSAWQHARAVTTYARAGAIDEDDCFKAAVEADPEANRNDVQVYLCAFYADVRQLFTGIQVAGPRLTPASVDKGFHAIPAVASDDPRVPACFYEADDYTCVKDAQAEWWDPEGRAPGQSQPGCWRMMQGGKRYLARRWLSGDVDEQRSPDDPCNAQGLEVT
jgi:hypothetical protein